MTNEEREQMRPFLLRRLSTALCEIEYPFHSRGRSNAKWIRERNNSLALLIALEAQRRPTPEESTSQGVQKLNKSYHAR